MLAFAAVSVAMLSGCASSGGEQAVSRTVTRFFAAVDQGDLAAACALLTPQTRQDLTTSEGEDCGHALPADHLGTGTGTRVHSVQVWSDRAMAVTNRGTVFLAEFDTGWLVASAGCRPAGDGTHRCAVSD